MSFLDRYASEGWLQVGGVLDIGLVDALRGEVERQYLQLTAQVDHPFLRVGDERLMLSVSLRGPFLDPALYANPIVSKILEQFLGEDFLIDSLTCVVALPGAGEQQLHRDVPALFPERPEVGRGAPPYAVTLVVPLVDLTPDTGTTRLFPGTHRGAEPDAAELPYVARGSCFLMDARLQHQGTPNVSSAARPVLYLVYSRPWFTDMENFRQQPRISLEPAELAKIPVEHRPLFRRIAAKSAIDGGDTGLSATN